MRAIIPVAGVGTRLRPHTHTAPKVLVHVAGKPMLGHLLDELIKLGIDEVSLIIGYRGDQVIDYVTNEYNFDATFIRQEEMLGLGHAISLAADNQKDDEPALIILGDTIFDADLRSVISAGKSSLGVKEVDDARRFGVIEKSASGDITRLVEKAENPPSNLAIVGIYYISDMPLLFRSLRHIIDNDIRTANEYQLTDALQLMLEKNHEMGFFEIDGWHDCGKPETLLSTNRALLDRNNTTNDPGLAKITNSVIRQPVVIEPTAVIENSIIGPHTSIAAGCVVKNSLISDSILSSNARVRDIILDQSIIADNASVAGTAQVLNVGDGSEIKFRG